MAQYHLETIPVLEAFETEKQCPFCSLFHQCEEKELELTLGGSVMEPDARIHVSDTGICPAHQQALFGMQNRLGHALLMESHALVIIDKLHKLQKDLSSRPSRLFGKKSGLSSVINSLEEMTKHCVICESIDFHMQRYLYTCIQLWKNDDDFKGKWTQTGSICVPHAIELLKFAEKYLSAKKQLAFTQELLSSISANLTEDQKDLKWFTLKFDYRNHDQPWGNSKDALERTVNCVRGRCLTTENKNEAKEG